MDEPVVKNTDRELWRETDDYYAPSIHVTLGGGIGINVGGTVYVMPLRDWHALPARLAAGARALRTRPDYDFRCQDCGAPHNLDTSIPSEIWNRIAPDRGALCTLCIDDRLAEAGLTTEAEFYFVGRALKSRLYQSELATENESLRAQLAASEEAREKLIGALYKAWGRGYPLWRPEDGPQCVECVISGRSKCVGHVTATRPEGAG
jgi:hypothetical protein